MPDIFDEVAEDLRTERTHNLVRRYGSVVIGMLVLVVIAVGGYEAWTQYAKRQAETQAASYLAAEKIADGPLAGRTEALPALTALAQTGNAGYRTLARLRAASIKADAGDLPGALVLWDQVSMDHAADGILRDFATLQWGLHQIDAGEPNAVTARLLPLTDHGAAWRSLAQEGLAMLALRQGQIDVARDSLKQLGADTTAPDGVRGRANGLLQRLGG